MKNNNITQSEDAPTSNGVKAPEFITENEQWLNSEPPKIADLKGKVVLIKFWTFMCSWCQQDLPGIMEIEKKYKDKGLVVIGIHSPETTFERDVEALKKQMKVLKVDFPVLTDNARQNWKAYKVENWPAYYLIDREGNIAFSILGPGVEDQLENKIKNLI
ncbi:MAG: redoxin domain-containing protein [Candidatus Sungiibacteriota bacterium]|uniref:Redoxin domain-containing protein n=1 Tax=Candidatus Sungiibacteriota bacterium TaxID=2750080 RepID=A0A7T5RJ90_9BACT|nr:MAG: redoxin domain-containing protein [Candidatus Sungbacteria bacterium]